MKTLVALLLGSTMALSFATEARTCQDVWASNPQSKSKGFLLVAKTNPEITDAVRDSSISVCESAKKVGALGGSESDVMRRVNASARNLPEEGRLSMVFMGIGGWQIGVDNK